MTETVGVAEEFANVCKGFEASLASEEGVDESAVVPGWGRGAVVWQGIWSDGPQSVVAWEVEGTFLISASSPRPAPPFTEMEERGADWRADDGWWSEVAGAATCCG